MKIKTSLVQEMHGSIGRPYLGDMLCFRTDKYGRIVGLRKPYPSKLFTGKQPTYQHQLKFLARYWRILTAAQKAAYDVLGDAEDITGYNYFIREKYPVGALNFMDINDAGTSTGWAYPWTDDPQWIWTYDSTTSLGRAFFEFDISSILRLPSITKAEVFLYYIEDACKWKAEHLIKVYKVLEPWDEATMTWYNQPAISESPTTEFLVQADDTWHAVNVTDDIVDFLNGGEMFYGWALEGPRPTGDDEFCMYWRSKDTFYNNRWPHLKLEL